MNSISTQPRRPACNAARSTAGRFVTKCLCVVMVLLDLAFLGILLALPLAWIGDPCQWLAGKLTWSLKLIFIPIVLLLVRWLIRIRAGAAKLEVGGLWANPFFKRLMLALLSTYAFVALAEAVLTMAKFKVDLPPIIFVSKNQAGETVVQNSGDISDPVLLWKFNPGAMFAKRRINHLGFREREIDPDKINGEIRVICMGDSITAQGRPEYAQYLHEHLTNQPPTPHPWEAFDMGVHGYSSLQGLKLFQTRGKQLKPDIVTIYFGWNDHWMCDKTDQERMAIEMEEGIGRIVKALQHKRVFMFLTWALNPVRHRARPISERPFRVPPEEYRATLEMLIHEIHLAGAIPILITAPRRNLTENLVNKGFANSPEEAQQTHDRYAAITREVARNTGADLLDLATVLAGKECDALFASDGIHFDHYQEEDVLAADPPQPGLMRIAAELDGKIREIVRTPEWQTLHGQAP